MRAGRARRVDVTLVVADGESTFGGDAGIVRTGLLYVGALGKPRKNVDLGIEAGVMRHLRDAGGDCDVQATCVTP